jgi:branched-chain amino acid transport system substrate-binding protein
VPDIGSQPIDNAYNKYRHLWDIYGEDYPRDDKQVGFNGKLYGGTEVYKYFSQHFPKVPKVAGVVEYNQTASQRFGDSIAAGLQHEGYKVVKKVVNFALPDYDSVAIDFKNNNVQYVYDTIDRGGNIRLCKALDDNRVHITAKVLTTQSWEQSIASDYKDSSRCRNEMWATGNTRNYEDTKFPGVADFRQQMSADGHGTANDLSDWALEGWAGGQWLADAAASCGATLTRRCVEAFMNSGKPYGGHGLLIPREFHEYAQPHEPTTNCINVVRWQDSAHGWVTQVPDMDKNCYRLTELPYSP